MDRTANANGQHRGIKGHIMTHERSARATPTPCAVVEPLVVGAKDLALLLAISEPTLWRWQSSGELGPTGILKRGRRLWPMAEIKAWVAADMPRRDAWLAMRAGKLI
jgi:predicted DNA-binding transcriptional regulator AlpA